VHGTAEEGAGKHGGEERLKRALVSREIVENVHISKRRSLPSRGTSGKCRSVDMRMSDGARSGITQFESDSQIGDGAMLPNPLHPAVVHFPVVLAFLLPLFVGGAIWAIRRGANPRRAWLVPLAGSAGL